MERDLPKSYRWFWTPAVREKRKGRPWGGELVGVRKELECDSFWDNQTHCCNGINVKINGSQYSFTNIYNRDGVSKIRKVISVRLDDDKHNKCIILGDWNARTGNMGSRYDNMDTDNPKRSSKDTESNKEGTEGT